MSQSLLIPAAIYAFMLFAPGYLALRCARLPRAWALCCAPIVSTALVAILGELYAALGIAATPLTVYAALTALPLLALVALQLWHKAPSAPVRADAPDASAGEQRWPTISWWMVLLFAAIGVFICNNLFVSELPSLDAVIQQFDNQHHLNVIRAFVDAQRISSLKVSFFLSDADIAIMPYGSASFYPAVWYGQCSLLVQAAGISVPAAINVSLAVTLGLAYPLGMCAFASAIFNERRMAAAFCALTCVGFAMFPWCLLVFGPLYPNLVGFALMPATAALCVHAFQFGLKLPERVHAWILVVAALIGQALLQPNTLFSLFVILVPFVAQQTYQLARDRGASLPKALAAMGAFLVVCLAFWTACYKSPFFSVVINEFWPGHAYPWQEIINIFSQTYTLFFFYEVSAQIILAVLVVVGFVCTAYDQRLRWLAVSYTVTCLICFITASTGNDVLKRFVAGFWYTDAMRLAAMAIMVASLIAANGLCWLYDEACLILQTHNARLGRTTHHWLVAAVMAVCFIVLNFMPGFNWPGAHAESTEHIVEYRMEGHEYDSVSVKTTFGDFRQILRDAYKFSSPIDNHEALFLTQVKDIVGDDLVINNPYDGSTLAYGVYDIRTYYRKAYGFDTASETPQSKLIRASLASIATNDEVRAAVDDIGARYVLLMDAHHSAGSFLRIRGKVNDGAFYGISSIMPDTPGFTCVLISGACHLYRID